MYPYPQYNPYNYPPTGYARHPYFLPRPFYDEFAYDQRQFMNGNEKISPFFQDYEERYERYDKLLYYLRLLAFAQIFCGGVLLVVDISKLVLLWNFLTNNDVKLEYISQMMYPVYVIVLGFVSLTVVVNPSQTVSKFLLVLIVTTVVPSVVLPRNAVFVNSAMEAMALARAAEKSVYTVKPRDLTMGMIQSEVAHRLMRMIAANSEKWPLGMQDLSQLSPDYILTIQYLLISYAMFSFLHLLVLIITLVLLLRLVHMQ